MHYKLYTNLEIYNEGIILISNVDNVSATWSNIEMLSDTVIAGNGLRK